MKNAPKFSSLQILRGVAVMLVVFFHATLLTERRFGWSYAGGFFDFGHIGVDLFFVLSGFIIYHVHGYSLGQRQALKPYLMRRAIRILPLYWFWTLMLIPWFFIFPHLGEGFERTWQGILGSLFLVPQTHSPIIRAGWSLIYEAWFYLLFGLAIWLGPKMAKRAALLWIALLTLGLVWNRDYPLNFLVWNFFLNPYQFEFILGMGAAHFMRSAPSIERALRTPRSPFLAGIPVLLGDASYSIYLTHSNFLSGWARLFTMDSNWKVSANIVVCTVMGVICYLWIERPMLAFLRRKFLD